MLHRHHRPAALAGGRKAPVLRTDLRCGDRKVPILTPRRRPAARVKAADGGTGHR
ncbi:hypothetical protein GCM10023108_45750 [Saccharopolyspora hordei]